MEEVLQVNRMKKNSFDGFKCLATQQHTCTTATYCIGCGPFKSFGSVIKDMYWFYILHKIHTAHVEQSSGTC